MKLSKALLAMFLILTALAVTVSCFANHTTDDCVDANLDHKCDVCELEMGICADTDLDHKCDYGCDKNFGICEDVNKDHQCDYGCDKVIGECVDADKDHTCDHGCGKVFGDHADENKDHACDYPCEETIGTCKDEDLDHKCDYGCEKVYGEHIDENKDHVCDYGCEEAIGECVDADKDHACDYGCEKVYGDHADENKDHVCDYGCKEAIGECVDADKDHACDYGCEKIHGEHTDENKDHACDYGCKEAIGECVDADKDHACDYGCEKAHGEHADENKDHACDYGCKETIGECVDSDKDHDCDYGCKKTYGDHIDEDKDHACDYGCKEAIGEHTDSETDNDHACDYGCKEVIGTHVYGAWEKHTADEHKRICNCGDIETEAHNWNEGEETTPATHTTPGVKTYTCTECSETKTEEIPTLTEHTYNQKNTGIEGALATEATCSKKATYYFSCICGALGEETFEDGATLPHSPKAAVKESIVDATCLTVGSYEDVVYCSVCDAEIERNKIETPALNHNDKDGDLKCDVCGEQFYVITLDGAIALADTKHMSTVANAYVAGTKIIVSADAYKTVGEAKHMFVGFDKNAVDNRVGDMGVNVYTFEMPAEDMTLTAKYAAANTSFFTTATFNEASKYTPEGFSAVKITDSTDADLEGLSGWSLTIPNNAKATTSKTNNFTTTSITAWGIDQDKLIRFVLKNHGDYDVTVEIAGEYFGYLCSTGNVKVPANSTVVAFMNFGPFSGAGSTCDFMIHVREDMKGDGNGSIQLDVVASIAKRYETKISDFIVTSDKNIFMDYGEPNESNDQSNVSQASASGMNMRYWDKYGVMYFYGNNNTSADTYARERGNAIGGNAIDLTTSGKFTIYVKVTNLYHGGGGKYSLVFTRGSNSLSGSYLATQTIEFTEYGESHVYAIEIDPSKTGSSANLQLGLKKAKADGTGGKVDVLVQIASENIFGELSE